MTSGKPSQDMVICSLKASRKGPLRSQQIFPLSTRKNESCKLGKHTETGMTKSKKRKPFICQLKPSNRDQSISIIDNTLIVQRGQQPNKVFKNKHKKSIKKYIKQKRTIKITTKLNVVVLTHLLNDYSPDAAYG
jgi:hypothetical protein